MRILFAGTPAFALPSLDAIAGASRHRLVGVLTRPDRPRGRGRKQEPPPVKARAEELGLPVLQPARPSSEESLRSIRELAPEAVAVVAFGRILKPPFLALPPRGCVNAHASLLPAYRGAAPIERAILEGETETGITTMLIDEGLDTGEMLLREKTPIGEGETAGELAERLARIGGRLLVETLDRLERGDCPREPQREERATHAPPIRKEEARVDWAAPAARVVRLVRAMNPKPVAFTGTSRGAMRIWRASETEGEGAPGTVLVAEARSGLVIAAGEGAVRLEEVQLPGKRRVEARALLAGVRFPVGAPLAGEA
ncbi:MAG: methionyl-tRNA formyltransferase [Candidatus Eisenbacteria bacterium]|nr:methionyl-tRNA formyltransferase [Candidatus Eisenbacteria bacterium]